MISVQGSDLLGLGNLGLLKYWCLGAMADIDTAGAASEAVAEGVIPTSDADAAQALATDASGAGSESTASLIAPPASVGTAEADPAATVTSAAEDAAPAAAAAAVTAEASESVPGLAGTQEPDAAAAGDAKPNGSAHAGNKRKAEAADVNSDNCSLYIARIPHTATEEQTKELFSTHGAVKEVILFRNHPKAAFCKGCGTVHMTTHDEAAAALAALDNLHKWEGMESPMVVRWMDRELQKRRRESRQGPPAYAGPQNAQNDPTYGVPPEPVQQDTPPTGCDSDTYKLFLSNIPRGWEDKDLRPLLEQFGEVVELVLIRDKMTKTPKGSAFLWYKQKSEAEAALPGLHGQNLDGRPLSVMKARPRQVTSGQIMHHGHRPGPHTAYPGAPSYGHHQPYGQPYGAPPGYSPYPPAYSQPPAYGAPPYGYGAPQYGGYAPQPAYGQPPAYPGYGADAQAAAYYAPPASGQQ
ncbi:hypothetical protein WJX73_001733 [Symbiochloris irregularis]|uniref:RRM domain-containing protein n=1 Tax=Symbiochloris irregularis TaxID=706552 RepID=A0AAW1PY61_9CHLO